MLPTTKEVRPKLGKLMLTIKEVAERLRLNPETVRLHIVNGDLKALRAGRGKTSPYRITEEALDEFLKNHPAEPAEVAS